MLYNINNGVLYENILYVMENNFPQFTWLLNVNENEHILEQIFG